MSHELGSIIQTSQKCSEPFQIFSQVIIASNIEPVRHVTPSAVGERGGNIVTHHMSGAGGESQASLGGNETVTRRRNSEHFRLAATMLHDATPSNIFLIE